MHGMPHKGGSRSPDEENDGAQTELAGASLSLPPPALGGQGLPPNTW
jgi:hypothetical protein